MIEVVYFASERLIYFTTHVEKGVLVLTLGPDVDDVPKDKDLVLKFDASGQAAINTAWLRYDPGDLLGVQLLGNLSALKTCKGWEIDGALLMNLAFAWSP